MIPLRAVRYQSVRMIFARGSDSLVWMKGLFDVMHEALGQCMQTRRCSRGRFLVFGGCPSTNVSTYHACVTRLAIVCISVLVVGSCLPCVKLLGTADDEIIVLRISPGTVYPRRSKLLRAPSSCAFSHFIFSRICLDAPLQVEERLQQLCPLYACPERRGVCSLLAANHFPS